MAVEGQQQEFRVYGNIGSLTEFKIGDDWSVYIERLEQYLEANMIQENRKVAVLLTVVGEHAYKILRDLCDPHKPSTKTYQELKNLLEKQFSPQVSVFRERIQFYNLRQKQNENVSNWFVRLKNSAIQCKFGALLEEILKDKFVTGLLQSSILDRLCEEDHGRGLNELVDIAIKKEAALNESRRGNFHVDLNKLKVSDNQRTDSRASKAYTRNVESKCYHCGKGNHNFSQCKYKTYKCKKCQTVGHLASICKGKKTKFDTKEQHFLEKVENEEVVDMFQVNTTNENKIEEPLLVRVKVDDTWLDMEVDSGAGVSVLPESIYFKKFSYSKLNKTPILLKTYNGQVIRPEGEIDVKVTFNSKSKSCKLIIVKNGSRPLLGRNLIKQFDVNLCNISEVNSVNSGTDAISSDQKYKLQCLLKEYEVLFSAELGTYKFEKIDLKMKEVVNPIFRKPGLVPFSFKEKVNMELDKLESEGIITKVSNNPWGTPLVPVLRANKTLRLCANYKITINKYLEDINYPLPRVEELFAVLGGGTHFSKLDFRNAYNQLLLSENSQKLLAWSTHRGIYTVNRLPYGTKPACAIFQKIVEKTLQGLPGVVNFLDDILVTGRSFEEHLRNLKAVFEKLYEAGFRLNKEKSKFFDSEVHYLGHVISSNGIKKDPNKIKSIVKAPRPSNVSEVRAFIGMVSYYGKFIENLSSLLSPLYVLLQKDKKFIWSDACEKSFLKSKEAIASDKVLVHYDTELPIKVACDSSQYGIGCVLLHVYPDGSERPISFASRVLTPAEKKYSVIHKESLALYWGVRKFSQYLMGRKFILSTDHKPILAIFGEGKGLPAMSAGRMQRWANYLSEFDYTLQYVKGSSNGGADGLSRLPLSEKFEANFYNDLNHIEYVNLVELSTPIDFNKVRFYTSKDPVLSKVRYYINSDWPDVVQEDLKPFYRRKEELSVEKGVLMWGYRLIIPNKLKKGLLEELHFTHFGISKIKTLARSYVWWPGMDNDIEHFVKGCHICSTARPDPPIAKIIKWPNSSKPMERIHLDFLGPLKGKHFLIITDAYSRWVEVFEMGKMDSFNTIEKLRETFARFGIPELIVTDNGSQFTSSEFQEFCVKNGIKHTTSPPYHPATNGSAENAVKSFKANVYKALKDTKSSNASLNTIVNRYLFSYRNTPHWVTGETPSKLMFGRKIKNRLDFLYPSKNTSQNPRGKRDVVFIEKEIVYVRDYRNPNRVNWEKGRIEEVLGDRTYLVKLLDEDTVWKRHCDQIIKTEQSDYRENVNNSQEVTNRTMIVCPTNSNNSHVSKINTDCLVDNNPENISDVCLNSESKDNTDNWELVNVSKESIPLIETNVGRTLRSRDTIKPPNRLNL